MKKIVILLLILLNTSNILIFADDSLYTQDEAQVTEDMGGIREGTKSIVEGTDGVVNPGDLDFESSATGLLNTVQYVTNSILGFIATFTVIYIVVKVFQGYTKGDMTDAYESIKTASYVIIGIALSYLLVSLIFWLLDQFTS